MGLEWAFRLAHDPIRLFSRYFVEPWYILLLLLLDYPRHFNDEKVQSRRAGSKLAKREFSARKVNEPIRASLSQQPLINRMAIHRRRAGSDINRRDFIKELGVMGVAQWAAAAAMADAATLPLKRVAAEKGLLFGSCLALKYFVQSAAYQQLFLAQCSMVTPEMHMKWASLSSEPGVYNFGNADKLVAFCAANHLLVRGHTLVWHDALPAWVSSRLTEGNGQAVMT